MDYKKMYNDALELARAYYSDDTNVFLNTIFPELSISKDEKIKKSIIDKMEASRKVSNFFTCEEINWIKEIPTESAENMYETGYNDGIDDANARLNLLLKQIEEYSPKIREGDKVKIHCSEKRSDFSKGLFDNQIGTVINVWSFKDNPWGNIVVKLANGCNDGFLFWELEKINN